MTAPTRVASGQPIGRILKASTINYALEGAEMAHKIATGQTTTTRQNPRAGTALFRNDTGEDLDRFSVLGVSGILFDPSDGDEEEAEFLNHFAFKGEAPDLTRDFCGGFGITQAPCLNGEMVLCQISGLSVAYINKPEDVTYTGASLRVSDTGQLQAIGPDCTVVWHDSGAGRKPAVVNLGHTPPVLLGKTEEALTAGTEGTVGLWTIDNNADGIGDEGDTATNVECYPYSDIDSGIWVSVLQQRFGYVCFPRECNA